MWYVIYIEIRSIDLQHINNIYQGIKQGPQYAHSMILFYLKLPTPNPHMYISMSRDNIAYVHMREEKAMEGHLKGVVCVGSRMGDN